MKTTLQRGIQTLFKIMKYSCLTFSILCFFCSSMLAMAGKAQELSKRVVNIKVNKGQKITEILKEIEFSTGLRFVYNPDQLGQKNSSLSGDFSKEPVGSLMSRFGLQLVEKDGYLILNNAVYAKPDRIVTGVVKDSAGLGTLPGVSVKVAGTQISTITDANGAYRIQVSSDAVLSFSMIGYKTFDVKVADRQVINVVLTESAAMLSDVVVVGYGTQKKESLTGAISSVSLDKVSSRSLNSVGDVIAGKSPGVIVTNEGGDPTSPPRINIRGSGGINGESVLYVVDGSIFSGTPVLNPNDIESISILKDASAAIYGARASGGVVLITTKKGKNGKMQINFDAKTGAQSAWKKLEPLNAAERAMVAATAAKNGGTTILPAFDATKYPDGQVTRTNWMDEVFRTGLLQDYNTAITSGSDKSNFYLSFNYRKAEGIVLNTQTKRYNFRINSDHAITPWLKIGENLSFSSTNGNGANTSSDYTGALLSAIYYPTNGTPYNPDGSFAGLPGQYAGDYGDIVNPVAELKRIDVNHPVNVLVVNPYAVVNLAKGLIFRSNLSITKSFDDYKSFTPKRPEVGKPVLSNSLYESSDRTTDLLAEQVLSYKTNIEKHQLDFTGGFSFQKLRNTGLSVSGTGFDDESPQYRYLVNANEFQPAASYLNSWALWSAFFRANYSYADKYLLSLIGRRDGTSLLARDNRFRNYYSASAGWLLTKEEFLKDVSWLNELKIRGSYGILGNLGSLSQNAVSPLLNRTQTYFGQTPALQNGYVQSILENKDITWAESKQTNIGLDLTVLNRLSLTADYFIKATDKMILSRPLSGTTGLASQTINAGLVKDKGIELGINYSNDPSAAFKYNINATLTKINNKVEKLADGLDNIAVSNNFRNELAPLYIKTGQPLYSYYVLKTEGIFQNQAEVDNYKNSKGQKIQPNAKPGDFRFADLDDSGSIDGKDRYFAGSAYPNFTYGLSFSASYKNFDINIFAQGVQGNKLFNAVKRTTYSASGPSYNKLAGILDAWSPENPGGKVPIISTSDANGNFNASDFYVENGSYLRLRNLTVGYTLPKSLTSKMRTGAVRIYATSNNLFTITKYSGFDPEIGMDNYGMDTGRYPQARSFILGLSVNL